MSKVLIDRETLFDIANAIRNKSHTLETFKPSEMADAIEALAGGGYSVVHTAELMDAYKVAENINNVYFYDGPTTTDYIQYRFYLLKDWSEPVISGDSLSTINFYSMEQSNNILEVE